MKHSTQGPRDKILWVLTNFECKMTYGELSRRTGIRNQQVTNILKELGDNGGTAAGKTAEFLK